MLKILLFQGATIYSSQQNSALGVKKNRYRITQKYFHQNSWEHRILTIITVKKKIQNLFYSPFLRDIFKFYFIFVYIYIFRLLLKLHN